MAGLNDLAILVLLETLKFDQNVMPITQFKRMTPGELYDFYGWGYVTEYHHGDVLRSQMFEAISEKACFSNLTGVNGSNKLFCGYSKFAVTCLVLLLLHGVTLVYC